MIDSKPWQYVRNMSASENCKGFRIWDNDSHWIAEVTPWDEDGKHGEKLAMLLTSAPDLLAACKAIADTWEADEIGQIDEAVIELARAAIAKAETGVSE